MIEAVVSLPAAHIHLSVTCVLSIAMVVIALLEFCRRIIRLKCSLLMR
jgi:hypothetical protein